MSLLPQAVNSITVADQKSALYLVAGAPFWFVPSPSGHEALRRCKNPLDENELGVAIGEVTGRPLLSSCLEARHLLSSLALPPLVPYNGQRKRGKPEALAELWFHLTDACNLQCSHCLFSGNRTRGRAIPAGRIRRIIEEALPLGCRVACFTGGEPFVYPDFAALAGHILTTTDLRIAVLTNGTVSEVMFNDPLMANRERIHLQVSLDGPEEIHDRQRGKGAYRRSMAAVARLTEAGFNLSVAMAVNSANVSVMADMPRILADCGVKTLHLQWHFDLGQGKDIGPPDMTNLVRELRKTYGEARKVNITIDNVEAMAGQVFSPAGTRFDLGNAGWESLAIGPDGSVFPTPALVDRPFFRAGHIDSGLERLWREAPLLERVRTLSLVDFPAMSDDPWRFLTGGGDIDHCAGWDAKAGIFVLKEDFYRPLYREMALMVIEEQLKDLPCPEHPGIVLRMGDVVTDCPSGAEVNYTHCNCLLSMGEGDGHGLIRDFYSRRAETPDELILNPVKFIDDEMDFIPEEARVRMYGCGSPVKDAGIAGGEVVVDLGSGAGVECFIASRLVGPQGRVIGVDMTEKMLDIAESAAVKVKEKLGYANVSFVKGFLEHLPLEDNSVDVVISNCVLNLTRNKRRVFREILRVLRPGGRIVTSDVVTDREPSLAIRADHQLTGECIGGALVQQYLFALLKDTGFAGATVLKRFPYRKVEGHDFYSLTFMARRPELPEKAGASGQEGFYGGPFQAMVTEKGEVMLKGERRDFHPRAEDDLEALAAAGVMVLDRVTGAVLNSEASCDCACFSPPAAEPEVGQGEVPDTGCLVCGSPLVYSSVPENRACAVCGQSSMASARCAKGHFVCDLCHAKDPVALIKKICLETAETDAITLLNLIRARPQLPLHGPEHHSLVPGVILSSWRNLGGKISDEQILAGIERGGLAPGGACAFMGVCGAAMGAGIAFSIILEATPLTPAKRKSVQSIVAGILAKIGGYKAARCCRRECLTALLEAAEISKEVLAIPLSAEGEVTCRQYRLNSECIRAACPFFPGKAERDARDEADGGGVSGLSLFKSR